VLDFDSAGPHDPDASTAWVYLLYGATMSSIQVLEHALAFLSLIATTDPGTAPQGTMKDQLPEVFDRWWRAYQKDTAGRALSQIEGKVPDDLYADLQAFIKRRNWLAHRFFIEQMTEGEDSKGRFARGTVAKLVGIAADCGRLTEGVDEHSTKLRASWPKPAEEPPQEFTAWVEDFVQLLTRRKARAEVWEGIRGIQEARRAREAEE
jgi:hypothetical protein